MLQEVRLSIFKQNGEWYDAIKVDFDYNNRKELIKLIKEFKKEEYESYIVLLDYESGQKTLPHIFK